MKTLRFVLILAVGYVGLVVVFESLLGYFQPTDAGTLVLTTTDAEGQPRDRVLSRLESEGQLYVAANHWPRAWYRRVLDNPRVQVKVDGERRPYVAVPVTGEEFERVDAEHSLGPVIRILTGFPPRRLIRLDPA